MEVMRSVAESRKQRGMFPISCPPDQLLRRLLLRLGEEAANEAVQALLAVSKQSFYDVPTVKSVFVCVPGFICQ